MSAALVAVVSRRLPPPLAELIGRAPLYLRYFSVSGCALCSDMAIFLTLLHGGAAPALAAAIGYISGDVVHWLISSRTIFAKCTVERGFGRRWQQALFFASGLLGLAITTGIVGGGAAMGIDPRIAKLAAIAASFNAVFLMRRYVVFAARRTLS